ncbi:DNA polymerase-3 subunit epsilon [Haloactinospora alba]|uniref:DNA polymerase-3 subunit epsilon n=1 Tax=Haloactinospora alba TaxID=405555 RepID=A0A543NJI2_9ACTN|nr:DEDD exonuclease domain-containing protein [Haloactinospora alba]TQN32021.1 DNA polymerase-3 subunit epsilon [Haloactinospora alba]
MTQSQPHVQTSLYDLGTPLSHVTFVVVDLETTGTRPREAGITEIGAVKVRGGEVLGEFTTLTNPRTPVSPNVTMLTGITNAMVASAPPLETVLPEFLEFAELDGDTVLVAHNAPFDVRFLTAACAEHNHRWPRPTVVDTLRIARHTLPRHEVSNHKLTTLASFFGVTEQPVHRALEDARATVGVLHGLFERLGPLGIDTLEELRRFGPKPTQAQRSKRHLARDVPHGPGVYVFVDAAGDTLYVGKSSDVRTRVRSYFTAGETRGRIREMIPRVERVVPIPCATALEADVRELRLIAERKPPYNRRSRAPERTAWLTLTEEERPRLTIVRTSQNDGGPCIGPFSSTREAESVRDMLHPVLRLRRSACQAAREEPEDYATRAAAAREALFTDPAPVVETLFARISELSADLRFEEAATARDQLSAFLSAAARTQRLAALARIPHLVVARPAASGWETHVVRHGRLAGSGVLEPGRDPQAFTDSLVRTAETVPPGVGPVPRASAAETERVLAWLDAPDLRIVEIEGFWTCPVTSAERYRDLTDWRHGGHPTQ